VTDLLLLRAIAVLILGAAAYLYRPFQLDPVPAAITGLALGGAALIAESRLRRLAGTQLLGAGIGACVGTGWIARKPRVSQASPDQLDCSFLQMRCSYSGVSRSTLGGHVASHEWRDSSPCLYLWISAARTLPS
jgi:hypothetical protein